MKGRQQYLDTFYVNGVPSITDGKSEGIRALNDTEKQWLDDFYKKDLSNAWEKDETGIIDNDKFEQIMQELKKAKDSLKKLKIKKKPTKNDIETMRFLYDRIYTLTEDKYNLNRKLETGNRNNIRNRCLYNLARKTGKLVHLHDVPLDSLTSEYSYFMEDELEEN